MENRYRLYWGMTTDVSGNSGLDGQSEEKFYGFASMDVLLWKYYELQIRILTSGRSDIKKINRKKCKIHSDENRYMSQYVIINCQEIFVTNIRHLQNVFVKYQTNIKHKSHPFEFQGCVTVYSI